MMTAQLIFSDGDSSLISTAELNIYNNDLYSIHSALFTDVFYIEHYEVQNTQLYADSVQPDVSGFSQCFNSHSTIWFSSTVRLDPKWMQSKGSLQYY